MKKKTNGLASPTVRRNSPEMQNTRTSRRLPPSQSSKTLIPTPSSTALSPQLRHNRTCRTENIRSRNRNRNRHLRRKRPAQRKLHMKQRPRGSITKSNSVLAGQKKQSGRVERRRAQRKKAPRNDDKIRPSHEKNSELQICFPLELRQYRTAAICIDPRGLQKYPRQWTDFFCEDEL